MTNDPRLYAPSAARNRDPIWDVLRPQLPLHGLVLEIASGSGEHITHFASASTAMPGLVFQPTDPDANARASIDAWVTALGLENVRAACELDASTTDWNVAAADVVVCINMIHISPWPATIGLIEGAARVLPANGLLFLYGPYRRDGHHTSPGNGAFDQDLRQRNPAWGVRDLEAVAALAASAGFGSPTVEQMPANNLALIFRRLDTV